MIINEVFPPTMFKFKKIVTTEKLNEEHILQGVWALELKELFRGPLHFHRRKPRAKKVVISSERKTMMLSFYTMKAN